MESGQRTAWAEADKELDATHVDQKTSGLRHGPIHGTLLFPPIQNVSDEVGNAERHNSTRRPNYGSIQLAVREENL